MPIGKPNLSMDKVKTKNLSQSVVLNTSVHEVYDALMDSKKHSRFTGGKAVMSQKVGGKFTAYDGYIEGKNLELKLDKKIVQLWRATDWPKGHFSTITYTLTKKRDKAELKFKQEGLPVEQYDAIKQGWIDYYWEPLKKMFN